MQIHRVTGASLREALLRAQSEYGDEAVVIQQEFAPGGGVTLSVALERPGETPKPRVQRVVPSAVETVAPAAPEFDPARVPLVREVAKRLARTGTSSALAGDLCREIAAWPDADVHVMDRAAVALGRRFPPVQLKRLEHGTRILALVGLTGVGKTTTLVKLAARMLRAQRRVEIATLDSRRVGAVEQLRAWAKQLGVPLTVLREGVKPHARAFEGSNVDCVFLDTTGSPKTDVAQIQALKAAFAGARVVFDVYLVLPATANREAHELVTKAYSALEPEGVVVTKLDETSTPAPVLEHALAAKLPIAFLSDGPDVAQDLQRSGPEAVADLFLRGRLA